MGVHATPPPSVAAEGAPVSRRMLRELSLTAATTQAFVQVPSWRAVAQAIAACHA